MPDKAEQTSKTKISKEAMELVNKYSFAPIPVIPFGKDMDEMEKITTDLLIKLAEEMKCIENHLKEKDVDKKILGHLYNTNYAITHTIYLIGWLYHNMSHTIEGTEHIAELKKKTQSLDQKFHEHEPFLTHLSKVVKEAKDREERGKTVYG